jgi:hypothetical protein
MTRMVKGRSYHSRARPDQGYHTAFDCPVGHEIILDDLVAGQGDLSLCGQCFAIGERQRMMPIITTKPFFTLAPPSQ